MKDGECEYKKDVRLDCDRNFATISLNRPEKHNPLGI